MPAVNPPRWITIRQPFDYRWPDRSALTAYNEPGEYMVKAEVADYAVGKGFATEGKADGSDAKSPKGKHPRKAKSKATKAAEPAKAAGDAAATDNGSNQGMAGKAVSAPDSADVRGAVDSAAE